MAEEFADFETAHRKDISDDEFDDLDEFDDPDLKQFIQQQRAEMMEKFEKEQEAIRRGTGLYREIIEKDFLEHTTSYDNVIVHFYHPDFQACKVLDRHLEKLAKQYLDVRFLKLNAIHAEFFVQKLKIKTLPNLIMFREGKVVDKIIGFDELGGTDDFHTRTLENRIARAGLIQKKAITRGHGYSDDESDESDGEWH
ncbi:Thioredoxin [Carpediemonas membranifera]|uniref:Thioredoxin n=1 Tax=Carpediemonas membranifera TaxID=201153 RepID=A0A8J6E3M0_9EUKA|nr:Thioredoxin [Carpediemonas membranifera]|eukprot:KAG9395771.1 Thioredoxin [Carpediemonas membranifera]